MNRRAWLRSAAAGAAAACAGGCTSLGHPDYQAVVDASAVPGASTTRGGVPRFNSVRAALDFGASLSRADFRIRLAPGRYREKLEVTRSGVALIGAGAERTFISFDAVAGGRNAAGEEWGTAGTGTVTVHAPDFSAARLTIENAFDYPATRLAASQALALALCDGSDRASFHEVTLAGYQDTLFADAGRSHFERCRVLGHVDFIFGAGRALFEHCEIVSRPRIGALPEGYITAPSTPIDQETGFVFEACRLMREDSRVQRGQTFLGRPWHPTRTFPDGRYADPRAVGSAVFIRCDIDDHIAPSGWTSMGGLARDGSRKMFQPGDARLFEYESRGPGALSHPARRELTPSQASAFVRDRVLGGWRPRA